jgi:hypothetical protein
VNEVPLAKPFIVDQDCLAYVLGENVRQRQQIIELQEHGNVMLERYRQEKWRREELEKELATLKQGVAKALEDFTEGKLRDDQ